MLKNLSGSLFFVLAILLGINLGAVGQCDVSFGFRKDNNIVKFLNTSNVGPKDVNKFVWNFGDGERSRRENPIHKYKGSGIYRVCLVVKDSTCGVDPVKFCTKVDIKGDSSDCIVKFVTRQDGNKVKFISKSSIELSDADRFGWIFGDGEKSGLESPNHIYKSQGNYRACLIVKDSSCGAEPVRFCSKVEIKGDSAECKVDFRIRQDGKKVKFISKASIELKDVDRFVWVFGDGERSNDISPVHVYNRPKKYRACLAIKDEKCGQKFLRKCLPIDVKQDSTDCRLNFKFENRGLLVKFYNRSNVNGAKMFWEFGDGARSTEKNPIHKYDKEGIYKACLITRDSVCGDVLRKCHRVDLRKKVSGSVQSSKLEVGLTFKTYPNPASGIIYLESQDWVDKKLTIRIFNSLGQEVFNKNYIGSFSVPVNISKLNLNNGIHLVEVKTEHSLGLEKLIIENN